MVVKADVETAGRQRRASVPNKVSFAFDFPTFYTLSPVAHMTWLGAPTASGGPTLHVLLG